MALKRPMPISSFQYPFELPHPISSMAVGVALELGKLADHVSESELHTLYPYLKGAVFSRRLAHHGGRVCAKAAISSLLPNGCSEGEIKIGRGTAGEPIWPKGIVGSITHTDDLAYAVAALASDCETIGIDSEICVDAGTCDDIASVCLTPLERARFLRGTTITRRWNATAIFCIKEAFYKAAYPRLRRFIEFEELEVIQLDIRSGRAFARYIGQSPLWNQCERVTASIVVADRHIHAFVLSSKSTQIER
jgi:enterobactin synthetase component D